MFRSIPFGCFQSPLVQRFHCIGYRHRIQHCISFLFIAGAVGFSSAAYSIAEDAGVLTVCVTLEINSNSPGAFFDMIITSTDGTATAGKLNSSSYS